MRTLRNALFLLLAGAAVLLVVGLPTLGQGVTDPAGEQTLAECYGHHKEQGFRSMDLFPTIIEQAPKGQSFPFKLTIRNPWLHELHDIYGYVNISNAPGLSFPGEREPEIADPIAQAVERTLGEPRTFSYPIPVDANATELIVDVGGTPDSLGDAPLLQGRRNDYDLQLVSPKGDIIVEGAPEPPEDLVGAPPPTIYEQYRIDYQNLTRAGVGEWTANVRFTGPEEGTFTLRSAVYYNLSKSTELRLPATPGKLLSGETATVEFTINAKDIDDLQYLRYGGIALAYHDHSDANTEDEGDYNKWNTFPMAMGAELRLADGGVAISDASIDTLSPIFRRLSQVLGFASSFLLIPSLVFGGTFGKGSVTLLNRVLGTPRRRVLFHNSLSFWLLGLSLLHMLLLFYESQWGWSHGLVWGGLALACMIGLGITGATQRSFVARWGFTRWRFIHFAMGILVAVFVLVHAVADGTHLAPVRELIPGTP